MDVRGSQVDLAHDVEAPRAARRFLSSVLVGWSIADDVVQRATLLISELVSNAVLHGGGPIRVTVGPAHGGSRFRVEVCNEGHGRPMMRHAEPDDVSGRGLQIVDELSVVWGADTAGGETSVWFEMHADADV